MIQIRRTQERGHFNHGWLDTFHTFSFGDYQDPKHPGFRSLRVINEDRIEPKMGFGFHSHRDMEILTYVLHGALAHQDSLGNGSTIGPGEVQRMSAGTGISHSEFNASESESVHLLQIWILPRTKNSPPSYEQKRFSLSGNRPVLIASGNAQDPCVRVDQEVKVWAAKLSTDTQGVLPLTAGRFGWLQLISGTVDISSARLTAGDGVSLTNEAQVPFSVQEECEWLFFDLG